MQTLKTGRQLVNPFANTTFAETHDKEIAVASALSNMNPAQCPKCGCTMGPAILADGDKVYYCDACRVTNPIPVE